MNTARHEAKMGEEQLIFEGLTVTLHRGGSGAPLLLLHGSGPGASSLGNWRTVLPALASRFEVFAMDLIGFGKSARKPDTPHFDFEMWVRQSRAALTHIERTTGSERIGVIGHSLSAAIALRLGAASPNIAAILTTGAMGANFEATQQTRQCWRCPRSRDELLLTLQGLIHDHSVIDEPYLAAREPIIFAPGYADYFDSMFASEPAQYIAAALVPDAVLQAITCPVTMLHGRNDLAFPASSSIELAGKLQQADLMLLANCSHSVAIERTPLFLSAAFNLFEQALEQTQPISREAKSWM